MPVQGDMIFTLGTNPVAEAMGKAAEPRLGQVLPSHPMAGQENNSFGAPHPGHLTSSPRLAQLHSHMHVESGETCPLPSLWRCLPTARDCRPPPPPPPSTTAEALESRASKIRIPRRPRPSALPYWLINSRLALPNQSRYKRLYEMASETCAAALKSTLRSRGEKEAT